MTVLRLTHAPGRSWRKPWPVRQRQRRSAAAHQADVKSAADRSTIPRLLILSVSAGAGHVRAAEALHAWAQRESMGMYSLHLDVMQLASRPFRKLYANAYIRLVDRYPKLWGLLYRFTAVARPDSLLHRVRRVIERSCTRELSERIAQFGPSVIVCTHFLPAEILAYAIRRGRLDVPVWVQVTDYDLHRMWVVAHMAGYFAGNAEVAYRMRHGGLPDPGIHTTGIPIMPVFSQPPDRVECAHEIGIDPGRTTLLLMGGGAGVGRLERIAQHLLTIDVDFQLIALAGHNAATLAALQHMARSHPGRLFPHAYTNQIERLMACADLAISKPGGLTTSECLAMGVPMIVHSPIPGQEERNADYLVEQGVALKATDAQGLVFRVRDLLATPQRLSAMRDRARNLARPYAGRDALRIMLNQSMIRPA